MSAGLPDFAQIAAGGQPTAYHHNLPRAKPVKPKQPALPSPSPQPGPTPPPRNARPAAVHGPDFASIARSVMEQPGATLQEKVVGAAMNTKPVRGLFDILSRPGEAGAALGAHRGFGAAWNALLHGESAAQSEADVAQLSRNFVDHISGGKLSYDSLPGPVKSTIRFAVQTSFDPTTYAGGSGLLRQGMTRLGLSGMPAIARASSLLAKRYPATMEYLSRAGGEVHDYFQPGGRPAAHAVRTEATRHGSAGVANFQRAVAAENGARTQGAFIAATQTRLFREALRGVNDVDQSQIFRAIHKGTIAQLPANLRQIADRIVQIDRSTLHLAGSGALQRQLAQKGFVLPQELNAFEGAAPRNLVRTNMYRENHVPGVASPTETEINDVISGVARSGYKSDPTSVVNKFFQPREVDLPEAYFNDPAQIRSAFERSFRAGGHAIAGRDLRGTIAGMFAPTSTVQRTRAFNMHGRLPDAPINKTPANAEDLFTGPRVVARNPKTMLRKTGDGSYELHDVAPKKPLKPGDVVTGTARSYRNVPPHIRNMFAAQPSRQISAVRQGAQFVQKLGNLGKALPFAVPFVHQRNILTLLATANPARLADAVVTYAKLRAGFARPEEYYRVLGDAAKGGATGVPNFEQSALEQALRKYVPVIGAAAARVYGLSGRMLWAFDDAAKAALYRGELAAAGGDKLLAGFRAQSKMVDYSRTSAFIENLRIGFPFAIWATRMPAALMRSISQHPERVLALYRATNGAVAGEPFTVNGKQYEAANPLSEINSATGGGPNAGRDLARSAASYPRARLSLSAKLAGDAATRIFERIIGQQLPGGGHDWFTSGVDPLTYTLQRGPGVGQAAQYSGHGAFGQTPAQAGLFTLTGIHRAPVPPTAQQRHIYGRLQQTMRMLQTAKSKNLPGRIDVLQRRVDRLKAELDALDQAAQK